MTPNEQRMIAGYAHAFRQFAANSTTDEDRERRRLVAKSLERHLSQELLAEANRGVTRPSEDETGAPTRAQLARQDELLCEYPNHAVFIDPLYAGDVSMEVWTLDGEGPLHVETVDPNGEPK